MSLVSAASTVYCDIQETHDFSSEKYLRTEQSHKYVR